MSPAVPLHCAEKGTGDALVVLHGLFGSSDNWEPQARAFSEHFRVLVPDLRNHGVSPHAAEHSYRVMAEDIASLMKSKGISRASLIGHSMGGKAAMRLALSRPALVEKLVVVDIAPRPYPPLHKDIFAAALGLDLTSFRSRTEAGRALEKGVPDPVVRMFLLKSLAGGGEAGLRWKINMRGLAGAQDGINGWENSGDERFKGPVLFVKGKTSDYIRPGDKPIARASFPSARFVTVPGTGHWPHADNPSGFNRTVMEFLVDRSSGAV